MFLNDDPSNKLYLEGFVDAMKKVNFGPNEEGVRRDCDEYAALMVNAEDFEEVATLGRLVRKSDKTLKRITAFLLSLGGILAWSASSPKGPTLESAMP